MRRAGVVAALVGLLAAASVTPASAHAGLVTALPAPDSRVESVSAVVLTFTEAPDPNLSSIQVIGAGGVVVSTAKAAAVESNPLQLSLDLAALNPGVYAVSWRVFSRVDGHVTAGVYGFGFQSDVGADSIPKTAKPKTPAPTPLEVIGRWLLYVGLAVVVGGGALWAFAFGGIRASNGWRILFAGWAAMALGVLAVGAQQAWASGAPLGAFLPSPIGRAVLFRIAGTIIAGVLVAALGRKNRWRPGLLFALAGVGMAVTAVHVSAGHAGATGLAPVRIATQWVHASSVFIWLGGLACLVASRGVATDTFSRAVRRFSAMATVAIMVVAVTGTLRTLQEVGSWSGLWSTGYGRLVSYKVIAFVVLAVIGGFNRYRIVPAIDALSLRLRRLGRAEVMIGLSIGLATALLVSLSPARSATSTASEQSGLEASGSDFATTVKVRLKVTPGGPGPNRFSVGVTDYDTGSPVKADRVALRFDPPASSSAVASTLELQKSGSQWAAQGSNLSESGAWKVTAVVQTQQRGIEIPLTVATRCISRVTAAPGQPTLHDVDISGGSVQAYADPGRKGFNEIHFTFFDGQGTELAVRGVVAIGAVGSNGNRLKAEIRQFSPGHFVGDGTLPAAGKWRFEVSATLPGDQPVEVCFEEGIK